MTYIAMSHRVILNVETYKMLCLHQETILIDVSNGIAYFRTFLNVLDYT